MVAKRVGIWLAVLLCAAVLGGWGDQTGRAAAGELQVESRAERNGTGQVELTIAWHWTEPPPRRLWRSREQLLAVSFDTHDLVFLREEAPLGVGAGGDYLRRLEQAAGSDGARRLFVIPEGTDGFVRVYFIPRWPDAVGSTLPFRVYVVSHPESPDVWMEETNLLAPFETTDRVTGLLY